MKPFVQFGCTVKVGQDFKLTRVMLEGNDSERLLALAILMRVRAPSSVAEQYQVLGELTESRPEWAPALRELAAEFDPKSILRQLSAPPPTDWHDAAAPLCWAARAAAVTQTEAAITRLGLSSMARCRRSRPWA